MARAQGEEGDVDDEEGLSVTRSKLRDGLDGGANSGGIRRTRKVEETGSHLGEKLVERAEIQGEVVLGARAMLHHSGPCARRGGAEDRECRLDHGDHVTFTEKGAGERPKELRCAIADNETSRRDRHPTGKGLAGGSRAGIGVTVEGSSGDRISNDGAWSVRVHVDAQVEYLVGSQAGCAEFVVDETTMSIEVRAAVLELLAVLTIRPFIHVGPPG